MLGSALQAATDADDRPPRQDRCTRARLGAPSPCHDDRSCHVGRCRFAVRALTIHMRASLAASDSARTTATRADRAMCVPWRAARLFYPGLVSSRGAARQSPLQSPSNRRDFGWVLDPTSDAGWFRQAVLAIDGYRTLSAAKSCGSLSRRSGMSVRSSVTRRRSLAACETSAVGVAGRFRHHVITRFRKGILKVGRCGLFVRLAA